MDGSILSLAQAVARADQLLAAGQSPAAEQLCRRVLAADPNYAPALHLLGVIAARRGDWPAGAYFVQRATETDGSNPLYFSNLCELRRLLGDLDGALAAGQHATAMAPELPQALNNLAIVQFERGAYEAAADLYRRAIALTPDYAEAHNNLGNVLRTWRKHEAALAAYGRALALRPDYADAISNLGTTLRDMGRIQEAEVAYRRALTYDPNSISVLSNLALALKDLDRLDEAATLYTSVLSLNPSNTTALARLAQVRLEQGRLDAAAEACQRALALDPDDPDALNAQGLVAYERDELDVALALFRRAIARDPSLAEAHTNVGNILKEQGRLAEARAAHERAADIEPRQAGFYVNLADGRTFTEADRYLAQMQTLEADVDTLGPTSAMHLHFALAKAYDDLGRHGRSFEHLIKGARIKRAKVAYDEPTILSLFDRVRASFGAVRMQRIEGGEPSDLPIFVLGMPRSGTTLVEQIIASHPSVYGAGELRDLALIVADRDAAAAPDPPFPGWAGALTPGGLSQIGMAYVDRLRGYSTQARRITDKMPSNFFFVGLIHLALPNARIIHVVRDPVDTCLSCFSKLFSDEQNHTYDLVELGRYYRKYAELMAHWRGVLPPDRMLEVRYEDVVADLEGQARRLIDHCGLGWDDACLSFHQTERTVRTASAQQVRRPIYATSTGRWRAYARQLAPLLAELGDLVPD